MRTLRSLIAVAAFLAGSVVAAAPITFIHTGLGDGNLDGADFFGAAFTITATGDTDDRVAIGVGYSIDHLTAQIEIEGVGVLTFITGTRHFVNNTSQRVGFSRASGGADLFNGPANAAFAAWDMTTSIGPLAGSGSLLQWLLSPVLTSGGVLEFIGAGSPATFQAIVGAQVPEPGTLVLAAVALLAFGFSTRSSRR